MSTPPLRVARVEDIPELERLIRRSGIGLSAGFYTEEQAAAVTRHVFGVDTQLVNDGTYDLIEQDGAIVACGGWSARRTLFGADHTKTGSDPRLDPATEPARIRAFFVDPTMARRGLGSRLTVRRRGTARKPRRGPPLPVRLRCIGRSPGRTASCSAPTIRATSRRSPCSLPKIWKNDNGLWRISRVISFDHMGK